MHKVTNIVVAGLGGQGVLKGTDILADVALRAGYDVKKSEIKGMSQRGGSVSSDVRYGEKVLSPMVPRGEADYLLVTDADQVVVNRDALKDGGVLIDASEIDAGKLSNKKSMNVALLGALSRHLGFPREAWIEAIKRNLPEALHEANRKAFAVGRGEAI